MTSRASATSYIWFGKIRALVMNVICTVLCPRSRETFPIEMLAPVR